MNALHQATTKHVLAIHRNSLWNVAVRGRTHWCRHQSTTTTTTTTKKPSPPDSPFATVEEAPGKAQQGLKKRVPVPINKTPRGQVAQRLIPRTEEENIASAGLEQQPPQHSSTHFIRGGVPCDPAPPPFRLANYGDDSLYTLVLLRHGESEWNRLNQYTGWCDVNLTERGRTEARDAGRLLAENGIELDHVFTSVLKRANFTTNMALNTAGQHWVPVTKSWRLNERHYGALQGYNKDSAYEELGIDQEFVMEMRRSYRTRPPRMDDDHAFWHGNDRRYVSCSSTHLPCNKHLTSTFFILSQLDTNHCPKNN